MLLFYHGLVIEARKKEWRWEVWIPDSDDFVIVLVLVLEKSFKFRLGGDEYPNDVISCCDIRLTPTLKYLICSATFSSTSTCTITITNYAA